MKIKHIVATFALAGVMAVGGIAALNIHNEVKSASADAGHSIALGNSGTIFLELGTDTWKSSSSKIALYMFDNSVSKNAWGGFVTPNGTSRFVEYSYNLDFTPNQCIAFRFDPGVQTLGDWCWENDRGNSAIWSTTNDTNFKHVVALGNYYENSKWTVSNGYNLDAVVKGGASDNWSDPTVDVTLSHAKVNSEDKIEVYDEVNLPANTYFKVVKGGVTWCGNYTAHASIAGYLSGGGENNIHNTQGGKYEIYFKYNDAESYITSPVIAAADEWSQDFLDDVGCDKDGIALPTGWSTVAASYAILDGDVKDYIYNANAKEDGSYTEQAVARYDWAVARHPSLDKFIKNSSDVVRSSAMIVNPTGEVSSISNSAAIAVVIAVTLISVTSIGTYVFLRKRKEN